MTSATRRLLRYGLLGLLVLVWQGIYTPAPGRPGPDPVVAMLLVVAFAEGTLAGTVLGFILGLLVDLGLPSLLGLHAMVGAVTGHLAGAFATRLVVGVALAEWAAGAVAALGYGLVVQLGQSWLLGEAFLRPLLTGIVPGAALTGILVVVLLRLLERFHLLDRDG